MLLGALGAYVVLSALVGVVHDFTVLLALRGLQGLIGWWMVQSGLETRLSVAPYRLAIHMGTAIILLGAMVWSFSVMLVIATLIYILALTALSRMRIKIA